MEYSDKDILVSGDNYKDEIRSMRDKIKTHLSNEYMYMMEKKDDLENELLSLKIEESQKKKTLFPNMEQKNARSYFSPFVIREDEMEEKDEQDNKLSMNIDHLKKEISEMDMSMEEIKDILLNIDEFLDLCRGGEDKNKNQNSEDKEDEHIEEDNHVMDSGISDTKEHLDSSKDNGFPQNGDNFTEIVDYFYNGRKTYPQMIRNLYDYADYLKKEYKQIEIFIEFNDHNIETDPVLNENILKQIDYNIKSALYLYDISTVLIQGEISGKKIQIMVNYVCDQEDIHAISVNYEMEYM